VTCLCSLIVGLTLTLLFASAPVPAQVQSAQPKCDAVELPPPVRDALRHHPRLVLSCRINPPLIAGDFDGDGRSDYALLVTNQASRERGFLFVFARGGTALAGAGRLVKYGAATHPDLNFDQWERYPKNRPVEAGVGETRQLKLLGDALLVSYHESASGLFYWDGKQLRWYQQGD
jgi:hypothetical protein